MSNGNQSKKIITNPESNNRARAHSLIGARTGKEIVVVAFVTQTAWQLKMIVALALITAKEGKDYEAAIE